MILEANPDDKLMSRLVLKMDDLHRRNNDSSNTSESIGQTHHRSWPEQRVFSKFIQWHALANREPVWRHGKTSHCVARINSSVEEKAEENSFLDFEETLMWDSRLHGLKLRPNKQDVLELITDNSIDWSKRRWSIQDKHHLWWEMRSNLKLVMRNRGLHLIDKIATQRSGLSVTYESHNIPEKYDNRQVFLTSCWENELNADIQLLGVDWGEKSSFQNLKKTLSNQNPKGKGLRIPK